MKPDQANKYLSEVEKGKFPDKSDPKFWLGSKPDPALYVEFRILTKNTFSSSQFNAWEKKQSTASIFEKK